MPTIETCFNCLELAPLTPIKNNEKTTTKPANLKIYANHLDTPSPTTSLGGEGGTLQDGASA